MQSNDKRHCPPCPCPVPDPVSIPIQSIQGTPGPQGIPGPPGPQGIQGIQGIPGPGAIESAFRAIKTQESGQTVPAVTEVTVTFQTEQFDFGNEYNNLDTFIPSQDGIYSIVANIIFIPDDFTVTYTIGFAVIVNGTPVATAVETTPGDPELERATVLDISTIYGLHAGDVVTIVVSSSASGTVVQFLDDETTHFAASRFPFTSPVPFAFARSSSLLSRITGKATNTKTSILKRMTPS
ncbi:hypothetical protein [Bacillus sp. TL12]|uniref:hypothetical protein n=1 Tax=Bacillus sp. TL12 TaxID=2894756 RepID=UPI001F527E42|nr:hypothetical protein [Bacillus sp. TL12]MCI0767859.1 hypothetical protein [Bacillus sp. TL12]